MADSADRKRIRHPSRFEIIAWMEPRGRTAAASRSSMLEALLRDERAVMVFEESAERRPSSVRSVRATDDLPPLPTAVSISAADEREVSELLEKLRKDPLVTNQYVAPPRSLQARRVKPGHTRTSQATAINQWGLNAIGHDQFAQQIDASRIVVGVVDSGVDQTHPDLVGAVEDVENETRDPADDVEGHGTHVCGIIAGRGTGASSIRGVANCKLVVVKGLGKKYRAREYYRALEAAARRSQVLNLSLGGEEDDPTEAILIRRALARNVVVVAAMGNGYELGDRPNWPAKLPGVIAVGAVDQNEERAAFSNTGSHISLVAPGVDIWSTVPLKKCSLFKAPKYGACEGTSMATPFVSGAAALVLATSPDLSPKEVRDALATRMCRNQSKFTKGLGNGILDLGATLGGSKGPKS